MRIPIVEFEIIIDTSVSRINNNIFIMNAKRGKNFDEFEKNLLIELISDYKQIIENKKTDAVNVKSKNKAWEEITMKYNASCRTGTRMAKQLHALYDCMKKAARKDMINDKMERYKTGGGIFTPKLTGTTTKIVDLLKPQFEPLKTAYDSSADYFGHDQVIYKIQMEEETSAGLSQDTEVIMLGDTALDTSGLELSQPPPATVPVPVITSSAPSSSRPTSSQSPPDTVPVPVTTANSTAPSPQIPVGTVRKSVNKKNRLIELKVKKEEEKIRLMQEEHRVKFRHMTEEHNKKMKVMEYEIELKKLELENKRALIFNN